MTRVDPDPTAEAFSSSVVLEQTAAAPETLLASPDQLTQAEITQEIVDVHAAAPRREEAGEKLSISLHDFRPYRSSVLRHPTKNPKLVDPETIELWSPAFGQRDVAAIDPTSPCSTPASPRASASRCRAGSSTRGVGPLANQLVEIWQANAAGRYIHQRDQHPAPLDPNFTGAGRAVTDDNGEYAFTTIKPGAYPWKNHVNAWRPAHIHFSVFGTGFTQRLVTQMYFPGDPLFPLDPIYNTIWRQEDRDRLIGVYDHDLSVPEFSMGYRFDIVVDGPDATWFEPEGEH